MKSRAICSSYLRSGGLCVCVAQNFVYVANPANLLRTRPEVGQTSRWGICYVHYVVCSVCAIAHGVCIHLYTFACKHLMKLVTIDQVRRYRTTPCTGDAVYPNKSYPGLPN